MVLKERARIFWSMIFMLLALVLAVYFFILVLNPQKLGIASVILAILTSLVALIVALLNNVKLKKKWRWKMRKGMFWTGLVVLMAGIVIFFLSGSSSGPNLEPTVPFLYGTNQFLWILLGVVGFVVMIAGLVMRKKV